jgi:hypothetical protein
MFVATNPIAANGLQDFTPTVYDGLNQLMKSGHFTSLRRLFAFGGDFERY